MTSDLWQFPAEFRRNVRGEIGYALAEKSEHFFRAFLPTLGDGSELVLLANFGDTPVSLGKPVDGELVYCSGAPPGSELAPACAAFLLRLPS